MGVEVGASILADALIADSAAAIAADAIAGEAILGAAVGDLVVGGAVAEAAIAGASAEALAASTVAAIGSDAAISAGLLSAADAVTGAQAMAASANIIDSVVPTVYTPFEAGFLPSSVVPGAAEGVTFASSNATASGFFSNVKSGLDIASKASTVFNFLNGSPSRPAATGIPNLSRGNASSGNNFFQIGTAPIKAGTATYGNGGDAAAAVTSDGPPIVRDSGFPWVILAVIGGVILLVKGKK